MGFWEGLGKTVPKKGYSKHTRKLARKVSKKPVRRTRKPAPKPAPKKVAPVAKWRPYKTFKTKEQALSMARDLRETNRCHARVDGTARGYQVWIKD